MRQLQLLDMTGMQDDGLEREPDSMSLWSSTVALSKACIDISRRHSENVLRMTKRRKGSRDATFTARPLVSSVFVEVRVDLFVNSTSYGVLREALLISSHSPLRFQCRDLRAEELSLQSTAGLLELLNPAGVRKIDLRFNNLGLPGLNVLLPLMTKFTWLKSLKLPYSNIDIKRLSPEMEEGLQTFTSQIGQLRALQELNLGSSRLSGRLRQLLGGLQTPLESLELAFCYLLPMDLYYLSKSVHVFTLKKIDLSGNNLSEILLQPFLQLLTEVSPTLMHLDIMECRLADAHLSIIMPALCRCLCLRYIGFASNPVSSQGLKTFLQNSVRLPELQQVVYPFPVDCFSDDIPSTRCTFAKILYDEEKVKQVAIALQEMLVRAQRSDIVWTTDIVGTPRTDIIEKMDSG
ncbi:leucine-rich repeat-containing 14, partial [Pelobates cultripes]